MPRPRPLEKRLEQVEDRRGSAARTQNAAAVRHRRLLRTEAALGEIIRGALNRAGVDAADAPRLALSDEAAAALAAIPDTAQLRDDDAMAAASPSDRVRAGTFAPKIIAMTERFAGGAPLDFADASFAQLLAWSFAQKAAENPSVIPAPAQCRSNRSARPDLAPDKTGGTGSQDTGVFEQPKMGSWS
jgi:hypothetical protein